MIEIIGGGLTGLTAARSLAERGHEVVVYERLSKLGGNLAESIVDETIVHDHGPHIFHTKSERVWNWASRFTEFTPYNHKVTGMVAGHLVPIPFNFKSIETCFPARMSENLITKLIDCFGFGSRVAIFALLQHDDGDLSFLGDFVYKNVFKGYSEKQWGTDAVNINPNVLKRVPVAISYDDRYFDDKFQGIPTNGYTKLIENISNHPGIRVESADVRYSDVKDSKGVVINTGPVDEFFDFKFGRLGYRTLEFKQIDVCTNNLEISSSQTNFPSNELFTRITRYGMITSQTKNFVHVAEYPADFDGSSGQHRYYPVNNDVNNQMVEEYKALARSLGVKLAGRLGEYRYFNMDQAISNALSVAEKVDRDYS